MRRIVAGVLVLGLAALAWVVWLRPAETTSTNASDVMSVVARRTFASTVVAIGAVKPQIGAEVRVGSRVSGRVWRLRANIGDRVVRGQVIAELETDELAALTAQRKADLRLAEAQLSALGTVGPVEGAQAEAAVTSAEATARLASEDAARQLRLFQEEIVPKAEADAARDRAAVAAANLEVARRALSLVRTRSAEAHTQAEAAVARARAALDGAQVDQSFTVLHAPISGIVASVATLEGETVAAGLSAPTFLTIIDLSRLQVNAYVDEVDIGKVQVGQRSQFTVDAFPARDFTGRVMAIYPTATIQDNVVKYVVALSIDDDTEAQLRPEMTTSVRIELESRDVIAISSSAVRQEGGRSVVSVVTPAGVESRAVRLGWRDGQWVEVVEGLAVGDRITTGPPTTATGGRE